METIVEFQKQLVSLEVPKNTTVVNLGDRSVNLGVHTDTFYSLLRNLRLTNDGSLKLEGRIFLEPGERKTLESDRQYQFLLHARVTKIVTDSGIVVPAYLIPKRLSLSRADIELFLEEPFTPLSLMKKVKHKIGFYDVSRMLEQWGKGQLPTLDLIPLISGCNQFQIGSNTLSGEELETTAITIKKGIVEDQDDSFINSSPLNKKMLHGYEIIEVQGPARNKINELISAKPRVLLLRRS